MEQNPLKGRIICVDGPSASGKGTLAKALARAYRLKFLDTGCLYRAVGWRLHKLGQENASEAFVTEQAATLDFDFKHVGNNRFAVLVDAEDVTDKIKTPEISYLASGVVAQMLPARAALLGFQQEFARHWAEIYGVVLDGRDCAARIAPQAQLKLFLTASVEAKARRRMVEYNALGKEMDLAAVLEDLRGRDERDAKNTFQTPDAIIVDTSDMNADEVFQHVASLIKDRFGVAPVPEAN